MQVGILVTDLNLKNHCVEIDVPGQQGDRLESGHFFRVQLMSPYLKYP